MSAVEALKAARAAGIELALEGDDLALSAALAPPAAMLDVLSRHKAEIVALLRPGRDGRSGEDWLAFFDERAGIAEFDGELPRGEAEARAFECCMVEWLNRNRVSARPAAASAVVAALNRQAMICCLLSMAHGEYSALMRPQLGTEFQTGVDPVNQEQKPCRSS